MKAARDSSNHLQPRTLISLTPHNHEISVFTLIVLLARRQPTCDVVQDDKFHLTTRYERLHLSKVHTPTRYYVHEGSTTKRAIRRTACYVVGFLQQAMANGTPSPLYCMSQASQGDARLPCQNNDFASERNDTKTTTAHELRMPNILLLEYGPLILYR